MKRKWFPVAGRPQWYRYSLCDLPENPIIIIITAFIHCDGNLSTTTLLLAFITNISAVLHTDNARMRFIIIIIFHFHFVCHRTRFDQTRKFLLMLVRCVNLEFIFFKISVKNDDKKKWKKEKKKNCAFLSISMAPFWISKRINRI